MRAIKAFLRRHALVRLYLVNTAIGFSLAALFVAALALFDLSGLGTLALRQGAWPFLIVLWFFTGLTFASAQAGMAIVSLSDDVHPGGGKRAHVRRRPSLAMVPATNKS